MTGIVLAGGASRRMGANKALLQLGGVALIERVIRELRTVFAEVIIVTNTPHEYDRFRTILVTDAFDCQGPLTGIFSGLSHVRDEYGFVVACDMPFLNSGLITYMAGLAPGNEAVVPFFDGRYEPLHAVYGKRLLPAMRERIRTDQRKIQDLLDNAKVRRVLEHEIDRFDPGHTSFKNLNTPEEFKEEAACAD